MATFSVEAVAARLRLDCSGAGTTDVIVKVAEDSVNGSKDFISDFVSFAALGRDNRGSAPVPPELRVAVKRACTLLDDASTLSENSQLIVQSLATCIVDNDDAAKIWAAWTAELIDLYPPVDEPPPPAPTPAPAPAFDADSPGSALRCTAVEHSIVDGLRLSVVISFAGRSVTLGLRNKPGLIQRISAPCDKLAPESGAEESKSGGLPPRELACFHPGEGQTAGQAADAAMLGALQRRAATMDWTNAGLIDPFDLVDRITILLTRLVKDQGKKPGAIKMALAAAASLRAAKSPHISRYTKIVADSDPEETTNQMDEDAGCALVVDWGSPLVLTVVHGEVPADGEGRDLLVAAAIEFFLAKTDALLDDAFGLVGTHYLLGRKKKGPPTSWGFKLEGNNSKEVGKAVATAFDYKANRKIAVVSWLGGSAGVYIGVGAPSPDKRTGYLLHFTLAGKQTVEALLEYLGQNLEGYFGYRLGPCTDVNQAVPIDAARSKHFYLLPLDLRDWRTAAREAFKQSQSTRLIFKKLECHPALLMPMEDPSEGHSHRWVDEQAAIELLPRRGERRARILGIPDGNTSATLAKYKKWLDENIEPKLKVISEEDVAAAKVSQRTKLVQLGDRDWSPYAIDLYGLNDLDIYTIMCIVTKHTKAAARSGKATVLNPVDAKGVPARLEVVVMLQESQDTDIDVGMCQRCGQGGHTSAQCQQPGVCFERCYGLLVDGKCPMGGGCGWPEAGSPEKTRRYFIPKMQARHRAALIFMEQKARDDGFGDIVHVPFANTVSMQIGNNAKVVIGGWLCKMSSDVSAATAKIEAVQIRDKTEAVINEVSFSLKLGKSVIEAANIDMDKLMSGDPNQRFLASVIANSLDARGEKALANTFHGVSKVASPSLARLQGLPVQGSLERTPKRLKINDARSATGSPSTPGGGKAQ